MPPDDKNKNKSTKVKGNQPATVAAIPPKYFDAKSLKLHFTSNAEFSFDTEGGKKLKAKANTPLDYVVQLQEDLKALGYLGSKAKADGIYNAAVKRAVARFQRHAHRTIRVKSDGKAADEATPVYNGGETGVCNLTTAKEIRRWIGKDFVLPLNRFQLVALKGNNTVAGGGTAKLRSDAAAVWDKIVADITAAGAFVGGTGASPYGDSARALKNLKKGTKKGASSRSLHHAGRAIDINQDLGSRGKKQRVFVEKEVTSGDTFWRLWGKVSKPKGTAKKKGDITCFDFGASRVGKKTDYPIPAGRYVDLTAIITNGTSFERIKAQAKFPSVPDAAEWWHFQFKKDIQKTFLDEVELIGKSEQDLLDAGWSIEKMDLKPG